MVFSIQLLMEEETVILGFRVNVNSNYVQNLIEGYFDCQYVATCIIGKFFAET